MKIKVLFICHGNICRSPMAEYVFKDMVEKRHLSQQFYIESAATSYEEIGNDVHPGTRNKLRQEGIFCGHRQARRMDMKDYEEFDYILVMDSMNLRNATRMTSNDKDGKIYKLLDFTKRKGQDIADPWYTGNFDVTFDDIVEGLEGFLAYVLNK